MPKVLILYYSSYGHVEQMAEAVADGARRPAPRSRFAACPNSCPRRWRAIPAYKMDQPAQIATVGELSDTTRSSSGWAPATAHGLANGQFLDQTGSLWAKGALNGKVGSAFTSTATQHGGQETTLMAIHTHLMHLAWSASACLQLRRPDAPRRSHGGSPLASTIAGGDGARQPTENELAAPASRATTSPKSPGACSPRRTALSRHRHRTHVEPKTNSTPPHPRD